MTRVPIANSMVPLEVPPRKVLPRRTVPPPTVLLRPDLLRPKKFRTLSSPSSYPFRFVLYRTENMPLLSSRLSTDPSRNPRLGRVGNRVSADREQGDTTEQGDDEPERKFKICTDSLNLFSALSEKRRSVPYGVLRER